MEITPNDTNAKDDTGLQGWTREEIRTMLAHADVRKRAAILTLASSGMRSDGLRLKWGDISLICRMDGNLMYEKDLNKFQDTGNTVCASVRVCRGTPYEYVTFITLEAYGALMEYAAERAAEAGRALGPDDLIFTEQNTPSTPVDIPTVTGWINRIVKDSGVKKARARSGRGHGAHTLIGFRRFWHKIFSYNMGISDPVFMIRMEYMMGGFDATQLHTIRDYVQPLELAEEYLRVADALTISAA